MGSTNSTLTDQIGAMSIVDKLRFQTHRVQDFMNIAEQKAQLVQKIAAGYRAEGVNVSSDVIEQGVEEWYKNRLTFKESDTPWYFSFFISRDRWLKPVTFSIGITIAIAFFVAGIAMLHHNHQLEERRAVIDSVLAYVIDRPEINKKKLEASAYPFVSETLIKLLGESAKLEQVIVKIRAESKHSHEQIDNSTIPNLDTLNGLLSEHKYTEQKIRTLDGELTSFKLKLDTFNHLKTDGNVKQFLPLQASIQGIEVLLLKPGLVLNEFDSALSALQSKINVASLVVPLRTEVASLQERAVNQLNIETDKELARTVATRISLAIDALTMPSKTDLEYLRSIEQLSRTEITLLINPFNKFKNGVERTFDETGGKAWYVIVQPLDETKTPVNLKIRDRESGREKMTDVFGVRVTKERYEQLKSDKADNGIIDSNVVGVKPAGKLDFILEPNFSFENILEW